MLVLAAAGKAFCAGHDLREMRAQPSLEYYERLFAQCSRMMLSLRRLPIPVIARVHGIATAAGCQLVAQCDLAVASRAARFAVSGVNLGLFCSTPARAALAQRAAQAGLRDAGDRRFHRRRRRRASGDSSTGSCEPDALDAEVEALVAGIVRKPRVAIALGKELFYRQAELGIAAAYDAAEPHHGVQHDGRGGARRRAGLHREARAALGMRVAGARGAHVAAALARGRGVRCIAAFCSGSAAAASPAALTPPAATGKVVLTSDVMVAMRDGTQLATDIYRPARGRASRARGASRLS